MSAFENLRSRKTQAGDHDDAEVAFTSGNDTIELTEFVKISAENGTEEHQELAIGGEELSEGDFTDQETGDQKKLIPSVSEDGIDSDGVVREYEVALKHLGFGFFHIFLIFINGTALLSDAIEVLSISFVLPVLSKPEEYGAGDYAEALLSSVIFIGMLFGSYIWGSLADLIGRRTTIVCSLTISAVFGFVSAFSPWFWLFVLLRFFSGFGVGGSLPVIFPYTSEFIRNKYRGPYLGAQSTFWMVGRFLCAAVAWAIIPLDIIGVGRFRFHSWRLFIAVSALPSLIGAFMYFLLPESPRFLLEIGKHEKALKALKLAHRLNHLLKKEEYKVKGIFLEEVKSGLFLRGKENKLKVILDRCKEILHRTRELFIRKYLRQTSLLLVIMFCLSFGSYGVSLWFPTYVGRLTTQKSMEKFDVFCNSPVNLTSEGSITSYCGCSGSVFTNFTLMDTQLHNFKVDDVLFNNVSFVNVNFKSVVFNRTEFVNCHFSESNFSEALFNATYFNGVVLDSVSIESSSLCSMNGTAVEVEDYVSLQDVDINGNMVASDIFNSTAFSMQVLHQVSGECPKKSYKQISCKPPDSKVYRDSFIITASAFPGNIASAIAVYFFRRNYWMAFSLFSSTLSVFLLYVAHSELFVVIMLCIFTAVSTPAWNDSSLLIAELYPTHLRSTAAGVHLLIARIGAIIGTNIFGVFIRVNPSIPILLVACILFVGGVAALGLPKTTRKTLLK